MRKLREIGLCRVGMEQRGKSVNREAGRKQAAYKNKQLLSEGGGGVRR